MELHDALTQIADIRGHLAKAETFRGYRSIPTALSGAIALLAAAIQAKFIPDPYRDVNAYLFLWLMAAVISLITVGVEMAIRLRRSGCSLQREMSLSAAEQFFPCLAAGAMLTYVMVTRINEAGWMLPGLWMILFSLGVFSSRRLLPKPAVFVGGFYMVAGALVLSLRVGLSPWAMGLPFAIGQSAAAIMLYWKLERPDAAE